jgi:hypothetical protein
MDEHQASVRTRAAAEPVLSLWKPSTQGSPPRCARRSGSAVLGNGRSRAQIHPTQQRTAPSIWGADAAAFVNKQRSEPIDLLVVHLSSSHLAAQLLLSC